MHPQLAPKECPNKHRLIDNIRLCMNTVIELNSRELEAVIAGEVAKLPAIKHELVEARKRKDALLESYYLHVHDHGC